MQGRADGRPFLSTVLSCLFFSSSSIFYLHFLCWLRQLDYFKEESGVSMYLSGDPGLVTLHRWAASETVPCGDNRHLSGTGFSAHLVTLDLASRFNTSFIKCVPPSPLSKEIFARHIYPLVCQSSGMQEMVWLATVL